MQAEENALSPDQIREFVIAGHGNLQRVKEMLATSPKLLNAAHKWSERDSETAIQAAAQVGNMAIAEFLLEKGAPMEICTAAMLGRSDIVMNRLVADSSEALAVGAHGIPLLPHSVWSGNLELVRFVYARGAKTGADLALHNAVLKGYTEIVAWLLENAGADVSSKNYQGKTPLTVARERNNETLVKVLMEHGAEV